LITTTTDKQTTFELLELLSAAKNTILKETRELMNKKDGKELKF